MKKLWVSIAAVITLIGSLFAPLAFADTSNFRFLSFEADYYLSKDEQNRSTLRTREKLVAEFPNFDQNHGIERAIPKVYDGHPVSLQITSVKNENGNDWNYTTYNSGDNKVVRIGDADTYVHGRQTYVIEYTAHDVTKSFATNDEFYWDTNGTGWQQPFGTVSATIHIDPKIAAEYNGRRVCFTGAQGSTESNCTTNSEVASGEIALTARANALGPGENLSVVVGFRSGTFAAYVAPPTPWWMIALIVVGVIVGIVWYLILPILALIRAFRLWRLKGRDVAGRGTIIPQYSPPKNTSVLLADVIVNDRMRPKAISASIIDLAVRGYLKIYQTGKKKEYELELVREVNDLRAEEQEVVKMLFGSNTTVNQRIALKDKKDLYTKVTELGKQVYKKAIETGLMADTQADQRKMNLWGIVLAVIAAFTFNPLGVIAGIVIIVLAYHMPARSANGVELREYLLGTKDYMQLAEADRMKVLQSPEGAEKIDATDNTQLVKLYEKLLPLAMLFGIEKDWAKKFADLYAQPPDWYAGNWSTFNAAVFASSLNDFSSSVTMSSFTPPSSSSSSGFSGGGSSGGGGGGGGGGGW